MKEVIGDIWDYHKQGHWIVITTNGVVKSNGEAVMGKGIALQARQKFPGLPTVLGDKIARLGNVVHCLSPYKIFSFPTKYYWEQPSDIRLIDSSCHQLADLIVEDILVYMVRPGCSSGGLDWKDVKPILEKYLDDRFIIVERRQKDEFSNI